MCSVLCGVSKATLMTLAALGSFCASADPWLLRFYDLIYFICILSEYIKYLYEQTRFYITCVYVSHSAK